mgnify:CR=1 FL=1
MLCVCDCKAVNVLVVVEEGCVSGVCVYLCLYTGVIKMNELRQELRVVNGYVEGFYWNSG